MFFSIKHSKQEDRGLVTVMMLVVVPLASLLASPPRVMLEAEMTRAVYDYALANICSTEELASVTDMEMLRLATISDDVRFQFKFSFTRKIRNRHSAEWNF